MYLINAFGIDIPGQRRSLAVVLGLLLLITTPLGYPPLVYVVHQTQRSAMEHITSCVEDDLI